jgi:muconolactone D-isomerase
MEWLVHVEIRLPPETPADLVTQRRREEAERAAELTAAGHLLRLWRIPGQWANWGLWSAPEATTLHEVLSSLPLYPWATIEVHPLAEHPNDPAAESPVSR